MTLNGNRNVEIKSLIWFCFEIVVANCVREVHLSVELGGAFAQKYGQVLACPLAHQLQLEVDYRIEYGHLYDVLGQQADNLQHGVSKYLTYRCIILQNKTNTLFYSAFIIERERERENTVVP